MSVQSEIANRLFQWGGQKLAARANYERERSIIDGQMAYQQGKAFEDVQMEGDKWSLEGYRLMDAQTMASSLLAAQREDIAQGSHALDPDSYRARFTSRLDGMLEGTDR